MLDILATRTIRLVIITQESARPPIGGLLHLSRQGSSETIPYHTPALGVPRIGQDHDAVADGRDDLPAGLLRLREVLEQQLVHGGRVDDLSHGLVVASGEDHDVEGVEREAGVRPR